MNAFMLLPSVRRARSSDTQLLGFGLTIAAKAACARFIKLGCRIPIFGVCPKVGTGATRNQTSEYGKVTRFAKLNLVGKLRPAARYASPSPGTKANSPA